MASSEARDFTPPTGEDWVLVIDDAAEELPAPGTGTDRPSGGTGDTSGARHAGSGCGGGCSILGPDSERSFSRTYCASNAPKPIERAHGWLAVLGAWLLLRLRRRRV